MSIPSWDGAPQTSSNSWTSSGTGPQQEMDLSGKLHVERLELSSKIEKLKTFISMSPKFQELDYRHRDLLEEQLRLMNAYEQTLVERMILLNQPNED